MRAEHLMSHTPIELLRAHSSLNCEEHKKNDQHGLIVRRVTAMNQLLTARNWILGHPEKQSQKGRYLLPTGKVL